jgi:hypothetical protein
MMRNLLSVYTYILLGLSFLHISCGARHTNDNTSDIGVLNSKIISDAKHSIHTGDIIVRSGKDFTSYQIRELSDKDKTYSHAGIALVSDTDVYIYHIIPPDLDENKADSTIRLEALEQFARPAKCFGFGIVRYKLTNEEITRSIHFLDSLKNKKTAFDHRFDLTNADKMYCSEMIDNTLRYATHERIILGRKKFTPIQVKKAARALHRDANDLMKYDYIPIDDVHTNAECTVIYNYVFLK